MYFGYVNGTFTANRGPVFDVSNSKLASIGARAALLISPLSADPARYIKTFSNNGVLINGKTRVPFLLNVLLDNKALQPPLLVPVSATVGDPNEVVIPFTVTILDGDSEWA